MHIATIYRENDTEAFGVWPTWQTFGQRPLAIFETLHEAERFEASANATVKRYVVEQWSPAGWEVAGTVVARYPDALQRFVTEWPRKRARLTLRVAREICFS